MAKANCILKMENYIMKDNFKMESNMEKEKSLMIMAN